MYQKIIMNEGDRPFHLENVKRPYSWTGELDVSVPSDVGNPKSWNLSKTNSFKGPRDRTEANKNIKGQEETSLKPIIKSQVIRKHKGGSSPILLMDKLPHYLRNESIGDYNDNETEAPAVAPAYPRKSSKGTTEGSEGGSAADKKRSKFPKLQRRGSPPLMTSQDDFEYFSLSTPPPGLARPVQIFPSKERKPKIVKKPVTSQLAKPTLKPPVIIVDDYDDKGEKCRDCMTRIPYATLIATVMCCVGVGVFCGTMYRGTTLTLLMFDEVFRIKIQWVEPIQLTFMIVGAAMGALGLMILFLGCLSTGSTRSKVYKTWRGRVGGRVSCAIFMGITYLLSIIWLLIFCALVIATVFYSLAWLQCKYIPENQCIDYNQFEFLFPSSTNEEDRRVCVEERKMFCKDCVNNAEVMFILATVAAFIVILSLIHYLMCLSANYAHIKDQEKFIDLQEIQYLQESEMSTLPKDRF